MLIEYRVSELSPQATARLAQIRKLHLDVDSARYYDDVAQHCRLYVQKTFTNEIVFFHEA